MWRRRCGCRGEPTRRAASFSILPSMDTTLLEQARSLSVEVPCDEVKTEAFSRARR